MSTTTITATEAARREKLDTQFAGLPAEFERLNGAVVDASTWSIPEGTSARPMVAVPDADRFGFDDDLDDYLKAPQLDALATWCFERYPELADAQRAAIAYRWKRKGGTSQGQAVLGTCTKLTGFVFQEVRCQYLIWIAADHVAADDLDQRQIEALLYHELSHITRNEDEETGAESWGVVGHDFDGFLAEYRRFGGWHGGIAAIAHEVRQQPLPGMEMER